MKPLMPQEREALLLSSLQKIFNDELTEGQVLRKLRKEVFDMSQDEYAALVGLSRRTLSDIENDTGSQAITTINSAFKPLGIRLGLLPSSKFLLKKIVESQNFEDLNFEKNKLTSLGREKHKTLGRYEIRKNDSGQYFFVLKAGNGEVILRSEIYETKAAAETGIALVQKNVSLDERFDRKDANNGKFYFNLKAANHQIIGTSQMYSTSSGRDQGIESVKVNANSVSKR
jgi:uncharacterized protein